MKRLFITLLFLSTTGSGMPTLETAFFSRLEKRLGDAIVGHDRFGLESILANDFELLWFLRTFRAKANVSA